MKVAGRLARGVSTDSALIGNRVTLSEIGMLIKIDPLETSGKGLAIGKEESKRMECEIVNLSYKKCSPRTKVEKRKRKASIIADFIRPITTLYRPQRYHKGCVDRLHTRARRDLLSTGIKNSHALGRLFPKQIGRYVTVTDCLLQDDPDFTPLEVFQESFLESIHERYILALGAFVFFSHDLQVPESDNKGP